MAQLLQLMSVLGTGPCWEVRRSADGLVVAKLSGAIDDAGSAAWRHSVEKADPAALFIDATAATSSTSLVSRAAMAVFVRGLVGRGVRVDVVANEHMSIVCRTVLRVAGANEVKLLPRDQAPEALREALARTVKQAI
jgi:hypothetical protein